MMTSPPIASRRPIFQAVAGVKTQGKVYLPHRLTVRRDLAAAAGDMLAVLMRELQKCGAQCSNIGHIGLRTALPLPYSTNYFSCCLLLPGSLLRPTKQRETWNFKNSLNKFRTHSVCLAAHLHYTSRPILINTK